MTNDWILSVLTDLQVFAEANDMPQLAVQLGETKLLAAAELSQNPENPTRAFNGYEAEVGEYYRSIGPSAIA